MGFESVVVLHSGLVVLSTAGLYVYGVAQRHLRGQVLRDLERAKTRHENRLIEDGEHYKAITLKSRDEAIRATEEATEALEDLRRAQDAVGAVKAEGERLKAEAKAEAERIKAEAKVEAEKSRRDLRQKTKTLRTKVEGLEQRQEELEAYLNTADGKVVLEATQGKTREAEEALKGVLHKVAEAQVKLSELETKLTTRAAERPKPKTVLSQVSVARTVKIAPAVKAMSVEALNWWALYPNMALKIMAVWSDKRSPYWQGSSAKGLQKFIAMLEDNGVNWTCTVLLELVVEDYDGVGDRSL
jgi:hypothetical protein